MKTLKHAMLFGALVALSVNGAAQTTPPGTSKDATRTQQPPTDNWTTVNDSLANAWGLTTDQRTRLADMDTRHKSMRSEAPDADPNTWYQKQDADYKTVMTPKQYESWVTYGKGQRTPAPAGTKHSAPPQR